VLLASVLVKGLSVPVRMYEYPYFMAAVFATFIGPQAISLVRFPAGASPDSVESTLLMTLLCVLACIVGYRAPSQYWITNLLDIPVDNRRLFQFGVLFICCGLFFTYLLGQMTSTERGGSQWTGRATIYLFFANLAFPGLAICLREALLRGGAVPWLATLLGGWTPVVAGLFYGRREPTVLFVITVVLMLYFCRGKVVPRTIMALGIIIALVGIPATAKYRGTVRREGLSSASKIDYVGNFVQFVSRPSELELRNAAMRIASVKQAGKYGLGTGYWDEIVFRFVPAQFVGRGLKEGLMFDPKQKERTEQEYKSVGYRVIVGSTLTGIGDAFQEFGYFGALFFAGLAVIYKTLWRTSHMQNGIFAQLLYIQTYTTGMLTVTHQTVNYLPGLIYNLIFLGMAMAYARTRLVAPVARRTVTVTR
jgi:hypothetical protein